MKQKPPKFDGGHNPDDAYKWLQEIERIFRVIEATEAQKVMMATHRLTDEVDFWWGNTCRAGALPSACPTQFGHELPLQLCQLSSTMSSTFSMLSSSRSSSFSTVSSART
ncbi:hypothetical protein QL285_075345 [Trifolium repens]|nr:hypothetical protein QL285_075345 [Trifolium repens]